uniref:EB domain-containing protein n=1 Tax=Romanomermis culicivorax TaxID=13658 RepID=A0A915HD72_ROMCU
MREINKLKFVSPNDPCKSDEICTGGSECSSDKICRCLSDTTLSNGLCLMNSPAIVSNMASISYTVSPDVTGRLKENFYHQSFVGPSNSCASGEKCVNGSMCNAQTLKCDCPDHMIIVDDLCVPRLQYETNSIETMGSHVLMFVQRFGQLCNQSTDCIFGLECWHKVCTCPFATRFNVTSQRCYPNVKNVPHDPQSVSYSTLDDLRK